MTLDDLMAQLQELREEVGGEAEVEIQTEAWADREVFDYTMVSADEDEGTVVINAGG